MYKHAIKIPKIQRIEKISHIIHFKACCPLVESVKKL